MLADKLIPHIDTVLRTLFAPAATSRPYPDAGLQEGGMSAAQKQHALGLMRVNHVGEVCAQALYQGQALTARTPANREALQHAAYEEVEHLAWTAKRVHELGGRTSLLNPVWYAGSLAIGIGAALVLRILLIHEYRRAVLKDPLLPADYEKRLIKNDFTWASANRDRILAEWTKRYDGKSEKK